MVKNGKVNLRKKLDLRNILVLTKKFLKSRVNCIRFAKTIRNPHCEEKQDFFLVNLQISDLPKEDSISRFLKIFLRNGPNYS